MILSVPADDDAGGVATAALPGTPATPSASPVATRAASPAAAAPVWASSVEFGAANVAQRLRRRTRCHVMRRRLPRRVVRSGAHRLRFFASAWRPTPPPPAGRRGGCARRCGPSASTNHRPAPCCRCGPALGAATAKSARRRTIRGLLRGRGPPRPPGCGTRSAAWLAAPHIRAYRTGSSGAFAALRRSLQRSWPPRRPRPRRQRGSRERAAAGDLRPDSGSDSRPLTPGGPPRRPAPPRQRYERARAAPSDPRPQSPPQRPRLYLDIF